MMKNELAYRNRKGTTLLEPVVGSGVQGRKISFFGYFVG